MRYVSLVLGAGVLSTVEAASKIEHVLHIMFENRAFDTIFGYLDHNPDIDNLVGKEPFCNRINVKDVKSPEVCTSPTQVNFSPYGPDHGVAATFAQIHGVPADNSSVNNSQLGTMGGFVQQALNSSRYPLKHVHEVMAGFKPADIPIFSTLAKEYMVADRWFSSVPGPTQPNRAFSHSGTSNGVISSSAQDVISGFPQRNVIDKLIEANKTWASYYLEVPTLMIFQDLQNVLIPNETAKNLSSDFVADAAAGNLPNYASLDPFYGDFTSAIDPSVNVTKLQSDGCAGNIFGKSEELLKFVYDTLRASPQWNKTLLLVTFDEHGGFFDHVKPPFAPNPDGISGPPEYPFRFDRLGVRVPVLLISPWIAKGSVLHSPNGTPFSDSQFEHSSIPATLEKIFNLSGPPLTKRTEWAGTFENVLLEEMREDTPTKLPNLVLSTQ